MRLTMSLVAVAGIFLSSVAQAQNFPDKPITIIAPIAAGSSIDPITRVMGDGLQQRLGQPGIMENQSGAGGAIGSNTVAKAKPDGYTILIANGGPICILPNLKRNMPYDAAKDFRAVTPLYTFPYVFVASKNLPVKNVAELIDYAKKNPGKLSFATSGLGEPAHLAAELLKLDSGIDIKIVHYRGTAPAMVDVIAGHVDVLFANIAAAVQVIKEVKPLAVTSQERNPSLPEVPTMIESGVKDFVVTSWNGMLAPAKTPDAVVNKLAGAFNETLKTEAAQKLLVPLGNTPITMSPAEFDKYLNSEREKWAGIIKKANIPMQD